MPGCTGDRLADEVRVGIEVGYKAEQRNPCQAIGTTSRVMVKLSRHWAAAGSPMPTDSAVGERFVTLAQPPLRPTNGNVRMLSG